MNIGFRIFAFLLGGFPIFFAVKSIITGVELKNHSLITGKEYIVSPYGILFVGIIFILYAVLPSIPKGTELTKSKRPKLLAVVGAILVGLIITIVGAWLIR